MKNIKYISGLLLVLVFICSCSKEDLTLNPISAIGDVNFYSNDAEILGAVIAIYDGLQNVPLREFALTEMRSDNAKTKQSEGDWKQLETFDVLPTNSVIGTYWKANYNVIFRANTVLKHIDVVQDPDKKAQYIGEAKFARALAHFNLVRAFGGVPIIDKVISITETTYFSKKTAAEVMAFVEADLAAAVINLPVKSATSFGRASKGAAQGLLAKVYLTEHNYAQALPLLLALTTDSQYALQANYKDVFYTEKNNEILFAIPYTSDSSTESQDFSFEMSASGAIALNYVTTNFASFMDPSDVKRKAVNINPSNALLNGKYISSATNARLCGNDWIVLRLADVYLMYAEAIMGSATVTTNSAAIQYYNNVRLRAGMSVIASGGTLTKMMLLNERRVELAFENQRLYDLIRFGEAQTVLSAYSSTFNGVNDLLLPIPQSEINVSGGLLLQNAGYN
jgi:hypothetical protein